MCHSNLDMRQKTIRQAGKGDFHTPILYLSELVGLAAGIEPEELGLNRHFVDAMCVADRLTDASAGPDAEDQAEQLAAERRS